MKTASSLFACILPIIAHVHHTSAETSGVGFSLSFDYGVAGIYFTNGSSVGIAKVEGGRDYKQMMRAQDWSIPAIDADIAHDHEVHPSQPPSGFSLRSMRDYLPPWLGGQPAYPEVATLSRMLRALKAATVAYVASEITDAEVVFPAGPPPDLLKALDAASSKESLRLPVLQRSPAGPLAAVANGIGHKSCYTSDSPEQLVLTLDYSRAALTAVLYSEECGIFESLDGVQDFTIGLDNWSPDTRGSLAAALRSILQLPVDRPDGVRLSHIGAIALLGEAGADNKLRSVVREIFEEIEGSPYQVGAASLAGDGGMVDPVFAAAIGVAADCLKRLENDGARSISTLQTSKSSHELK